MRAFQTMLAVGLAGSAAAAQSQTYVEDFTTTTFRDSANTEIDWNTTDGELKLHAVPAIGASLNRDATGFAVQGDLAYLAGGSALEIVDISDPSKPALVHSFDGLQVVDVAVDGDHAFLASGNSTIYVINIANPTSPYLVTTHSITPDDAVRIEVEGGLAFVGTTAPFSHVIDVRDRANPSHKAYLEVWNASDFAVAGNLVAAVHVQGGTQGIRFFDLVDPDVDQVHVDFFSIPEPTSVAVDGNVAYVGTDASGLYLLDISDPTNVSLLANLDTVSARGVDVFGTRAIVVADNQLNVVNVADPTAPSVVGMTYTVSDYNNVQVHGDVAWVFENNLRAVRLAGLLAPTFRGAESMTNAYDVEIQGDRLFLAADDLVIRDRSLDLVGTYETLGQLYGVDVAGDHAFVAEGNAGLVVVDISDPTSPQLEGSYDTPGFAFDLMVAGDYAYVADNTSLQIVDITNLSSPQFEGSISLNGSIQGVDLQDNLAYLATGTRGLQIVDVTDPTNPTFVGDRVNGNNSARSVDVVGDYAYVAYAESGLRIYDVSDPTNPTHERTIDTAGESYGVEVSGDLLFLADGSAGVHTYDITDPVDPVLVGTRGTPGSARATRVDRLDIFVADVGSVRKVNVRQDATDSWRTEGRSSEIDDEGRTIPRARLSTPLTSTGLSWELSSDGGTTWIAATDPTLGLWHAFPQAGDELMWRSTHIQAPNKPNPTATDLTIDWRTDSARLTDVSDVPDDDGGQVRIAFNNSGYDFADEADLPITGYQLYRKVDGSEESMASSGGGSNGRVAISPALASLKGQAQRIGNRWFVQGTDPDGSSTEESSGNGFPPGTWELLSFHAATQQESYLLHAPTLADGVQTEFLLTTHTTTPTVWFVSDPMPGTSWGELPGYLPTTPQPKR